jgi:hypothetical protein
MLNISIGDAVDRLAAVARLQNSGASVRSRGREMVQAAAAISTRATNQQLPDFWAYQTCTEFGGYMTCDVGSRCFFSQGLLKLQALMSFCSEQFGISDDAVARNVDATNTRYGSAAPAVSCAVYANGEIDPFAPMGVQESVPDRLLFALSVPGTTHSPNRLYSRSTISTLQHTLNYSAGASHHSWTHPSSPSDQSSVVAARSKIRQLVQIMLRADCFSQAH